MFAQRLRWIPNLILNTRLRCKMAPVTRKQLTSLNSNSKDGILKETTKKQSSKGRQKQPATGKDGLPIVPFPSPNELEKWLELNHSSMKGVWVKIAKKASGIPSITYEEMLDVALCFGWIDGQRSGYDETWFLQRITPRRPKSNWSQINREKVKRLIRIGKMQPAGQAFIDEAKADGRWDNAYKPSSGCCIPDELVAAIEVSSQLVQETFKRLPKESKLKMVSQIQEANATSGDCAECIKTLIDEMESGGTLNT